MRLFIDFPICNIFAKFAGRMVKRKNGSQGAGGLLPLSRASTSSWTLGTIIYVGKAKSLRKRVSSYFVQSKEHSAKVRVLVKQIVEIRHIVVGSETDACAGKLADQELQPRYKSCSRTTRPIVDRRAARALSACSRRASDARRVAVFRPYGSVMMQRSVLDFIAR